MNRIAVFEKVSFEEWKKAMNDIFSTKEGDVVTPIFTEEYLTDAYEKIKLPQRATKLSAGYDFYTPIQFQIWDDPKSSIKIPTGIKVNMSDSWVLTIFPRSSLGFKYNIKLCNTCGIVDADYYNNESNEGHIFIKLHGANSYTEIKEGSAIAQGIFLQYGITIDDEADGERKGGIGSTGK